MSYWSGLYSLEFQGKLADSIKVLMGVAYKLLAQQVAPSIAGQTGRTAQHGTGTVLARHGRHGQHSVPCRASPRADLQARARLLEAIGVPCRAPGTTCQSMACRAIQARLAREPSSNMIKFIKEIQRQFNTTTDSQSQQTKTKFKGKLNFIGAVLSAASLKTFVGKNSHLERKPYERKKSTASSKFKFLSVHYKPKFNLEQPPRDT